MKKLLLLMNLCLFFAGVSYATIWEVTTDSDGFSSSPLSFRQANTLAVNGDTIRIQVHGSMNLASSVTISKNLTIIGPAPVHFTFYSNAGTGSIIIQSFVKFQDIKFADKPSGTESLILINSAGSGATFERCLFRDIYNNINGPAIDISQGTATLINCSIFNCLGANGGAINTHGDGTLNAHSCSFINCSSNFNGGALNFETNAKGYISHCTFFNNSAALQGGAIYAGVTGTGQVDINSCLFAPNNTSTTGGDNIFSSGFNVTSIGNNMMNDNAGAPQFTDLANGNKIGGSYAFGLRTQHVEDGYGMCWVPITNPSSDAIDGGMFNPYPNDNRRAPRNMADGIIGFNTDIGAVEYTPLRVTDWSGPNDLAAIISTYNGLGGELYVEFDIPTTGDFTSAPGNINGFSTDKLFIDGFSQQDSKVPGPANNSGIIQEGIMPISMDLSGGNSLVFNGASGSVSGIAFRNANNGVVVTANVFDEVHIFGNYFGLHEDGTGSAGELLQNFGINLQGTFSPMLIGGHFAYERNVFGNITNHSVNLNNSSSTTIVGNFFGTDGTGLISTNLSASQPKGVSMTNEASGTEIIDNLFGGLDYGIYSDDCGDISAFSNKIGFAYDGNAMAIDKDGIHFENHFGGPFRIGNANETNIIGNCLIGIHLIDLFDSPDITIRGNLIGLDESSTAHPNNSGIVLSSSEEAQIGGPNVGDRNTISANSNRGILLENGSNACIISNNYFGSDRFGDAIASMNNGVSVELNQSSGNDIGDPLHDKNYFVNSNGPAILLDSSNNINIYNNQIGIDKSNNPSSTLSGIYLDGAQQSRIGGFNPNEGNIIANVSQNGLDFKGASRFNVITRDSIFNNGLDGINTDGTSAYDNRFYVNWIYDNGDLGIDQDNGSQISIERPTITSASKCGSDINVQVDLSATTGNITFEYYSIPAGGEDPSGFGEGNTPEQLVGPVTISASPFTQTDVFTSAAGPGDYISCLISRESGPNQTTSEFSNHMVLASPVDGSITTWSNVTCPSGNNGVINFNITNGSAPYTCELINSVSSTASTLNPATTGSYSFTNLSPETYYLVTTDASGCKDTSSSQAITEPNAFDLVNPFVASETCPGANDGSIDISLATGGTGALQFSLDGSTFQGTGNFSGLTPGTYYATIRDASLCDSTFTGIALTVGSGTDITPPAFTHCITDTTVYADAACQYLVPDFSTVASASDNCGTVTINQSAATPSGSNIGLGTYNTFVSANDGNGNIDTCFFMLTVLDTTPPSPVSLPNLTGSCTVNVPTPSTTDNCDGTIFGTTTDATTYSSAGTFTITWTFTDGSGNTETANQSVIIDAIDSQTLSLGTSPICPNTASTVDINSSESPFLYCLRNDLNDTLVDGPLVGNGSMLTFNTGNINVNTTYNVIAKTPSHVLSYDAVDDEVDYGDNFEGLTEYSMEGWVYLDGGSQRIILSEKFHVHSFGAYNGQIRFVWGNAAGNLWSSGGIYSPTLPTNQWVHIAVVQRSVPTTELQFYINGVPSTIYAGSHNLPTNANTRKSLTVPGSSANNKMDEVRLWDRSLTSAEVLEYMDVCMTGSEPNLQAYYKFDEGSGTTVNDLSPNNYTGTINNGAGASVEWHNEWPNNCTGCELEMPNLVTITIQDNPPTVATNPGNMTVNNDAGVCSAVVNYTPPTFDDDCDGTSLAGTLTAGTASGGTFPLGTTTVTYTYTDASSQVVSTSFDITVTDNENPTITCLPNQNEALDASCQFTLPDYKAYAGVTTNDNCGVFSVTQSPLPGTVITGTTTITLTVTDNDGNTSNCNFDVIPTDQTDPVAVCQNITVVLGNTGNASIVASALDNGSTDNCSGVTFSASQTSFTCADLSAGTSTGTVSVNLTVTDGDGNTDICTSTVTVDGSAVSTAFAGADQSLCEGLPAIIGGTATGPNNIMWTTSGTGNFSSLTLPNTDYTPGAGETGSVYAVMELSGACPTVIDSMLITYLDAPDFIFSSTDENCGMGDGTITVNASGASGAYEYTYNGGTAWGANSMETGLSAGNYDVIVRDATTLCKSAIQTVTIGNIQGVLWDQMTTTDISCNGANDGEVEGTTINPNYPHTYILNPTGTTQNSDSLFLGLDDGNYDYIVVAANGCSDTIQININEPGPINITVSVTDYCLPQFGQIDVSVIGGTGPFQYSLDDINYFSNNVFDTLLPTYDSVFVQDLNGCSNWMDFTIDGTILPQPTMTLNNPYCEGAPFIASASTAVGADSLFWYYEQTLTDIIPGLNVNLWPSHTSGDSVYVTYIENGCYAFPVGDILTIEQSTLDGGPNLTICPGDSALLMASHGTGTFAWISADVSDPSDPNSYVSVNADTYILASLQTANCVFTDSVLITVDDNNPDCGMGVANAFSPDGDGINDTWIIEAVIDNPVNEVYIYNRWGDQLEHFSNYDNTNVVWSPGASGGQINGGTSSPATNGTYYYVIEFPETGTNLTGWVQVTR